MITNSDITIYNKCYDEETQSYSKYKRTYIKGVNIQIDKAVSVGDKGLNTADNVSVYIPFTADFSNKKYIKPKEYDRLSDKDKEYYFTIGKGDIIVKGIIDFDITGRDKNTIKHLNNLYDDVYTITNISTNDFGSLSMQHWEVGAK